MSIVDKISGLDTADNPLSGVKEGSLKTADNVVIRSKNVLEPRRGQVLTGGTFGLSAARANAFAFFSNGMVVSNDNAGVHSLGYGNGTATYTNVASITPPAATTLRTKFAGMNDSLYFTSTAGIYAMDGLSAPRSSGTLQANDCIGTLNTAPDATGTWLPANSQVAYRVVYGFKDATTGALIHWGPPSGRLVLINPAPATTSVVLSRTSNVVTATFAAAHGFAVNAFVKFTGVSDGTFANTTQAIDSVSSDGKAFTYVEVGANGSSGLVHTFTGGYQAPSIGFTPLPDSTTAYYIRVFRSAYTSAATIKPTDEMYLVQEFTNVNPAPGAYGFYDKTPELALYSFPLYTNELTGEGALQANYRPPLARDITVWNDRMWFANTTERHVLDVQCLGVSAPGGFQAGDTVTVGGATYTGSATTDSSTTVRIRTEGDPTENTAATMRALVYQIEANFFSEGSTVRAYYVSGADDAPGKIRFENKGYSTTGFTFATSRTTAFNPSISPQSSKQNVFPNRLYFSKVSEPEAVPLLNYVDVGPKNKAILRVVPSREKLFVFKEDAIYTVSGNAPNLRVDLLDNTAWLLAPDSVVAANNQIFALTNQGVVAVTEGGVRILSRPVEDKLEQGFFRPIAAGTSTVKAMVWGAAYESEHQYILGLTTSASSTTADQILVYNYLLDRWTRWPVGRKFAAVNPTTDVLWLASASTNQLISERKTFTHADYVDGTTTLTITAVDATARTVTVSSTTGLSVGDGITDASGSRAIITAINGLVLTLVAVAASGAVVGAGHILDASTVALWRFNDTTATALVEEKGLYPGASSTGTPTVVTGQIGSGKHLSTATITTTGANDTFRSMFGGTAWTVEWWMRLDSIGAGLAIRPIMSMSSGFNSDTLRIQTSATGRLLVGSTAGGVYVGDTLSLGVWKHYALTRVALGGADGSSVRYKLWENGVYTPANGLSVVMSPTATPLAGQQIVFGNSGESAGSFEAANCMLDDVRISNAVRTDAEILESYQRGSTGSTLSYFETSSATGHAAIPVDVEFNPVGGAAPGTLKQFKSTTLHFNYLNIYDFDATCRTELSTTEAATAMTTPAFAIYTSPYENVNVRLFCPLEKQRATLMRVGVNVSEAWSRWQLNGFTVDDDSTSDRNSR